MFIALPDIPSFVFEALAHGADDPEHPFHLLTLATVSADGRPSARLMVNRGADRERGRLWFHTDAHSPKVADLRACRAVCVVGWDPRRAAEIRLSGECTVHTADRLADDHWDHFSRSALWMYENPAAPQATPGQGPVDLRLPNDRITIQHNLTARARARFVVLQVSIVTIDWLQADDKSQVRVSMRADEQWLPRAV